MGALTISPAKPSSPRREPQASPAPDQTPDQAQGPGRRAARHTARHSVGTARLLRRSAVIIFAMTTYAVTIFAVTIFAAISAFGLAFVPCARGQDIGRWRPLISEASARFDVPPGWIEAVIRAESGGRATVDGRPIRSTKGAIGLMQLMPRTWAELRGQLHLGDDPDAPRDNILAGTYYLRLLHDRYGFPGVFAAYNAGPGRYERFLAGGTLPAETRAYLARVIGRSAPGGDGRYRFPAEGPPPPMTHGALPHGGMLPGSTGVFPADRARISASDLVSGPGSSGSADSLPETADRWRGALPRTAPGEGASVFAVLPEELASTGSDERDGGGGDPGAKPDPLFAIRRQRGSDGAP